MRRISLFFLFPVLLLANECFQFSCAIGYRRDKAEMDFPGIYSSTDFLNSVEFGSTMRIQALNFLFSLDGDVGWFVSGSGSNDVPLQAPSRETLQEKSNYSSGGFFTDGWANFGYPLGEVYQFLPQASFGIFYQQISQGECHPAGPILSHSRLKRLWFGPGAGADLIARPDPAWLFSAGYFYYFLHFDQSFNLFSDLLYSSPSFAEYFLWQKYRASTYAHGQKISGKISAQIAQEWRFNLRFDAFLFSAKNPGTLKQDFTQLFPLEATFSEKVELQGSAAWQAYSAFVEIEYFF